MNKVIILSVFFLTTIGNELHTSEKEQFIEKYGDTNFYLSYYERKNPISVENLFHSRILRNVVKEYWDVKKEDIAQTVIEKLEKKEGEKKICIIPIHHYVTLNSEKSRKIIENFANETIPKNPSTLPIYINLANIFNNQKMLDAYLYEFAGIFDRKDILKFFQNPEDEKSKLINNELKKLPLDVAWYRLGEALLKRHLPSLAIQKKKSTIDKPNKAILPNKRIMTISRITDNYSPVIEIIKLKKYPGFDYLPLFIPIT